MGACSQVYADLRCIEMQATLAGNKRCGKKPAFHHFPQISGGNEYGCPQAWGGRKFRGWWGPWRMRVDSTGTLQLGLRQSARAVTDACSKCMQNTNSRKDTQLYAQRDWFAWRPSPLQCKSQMWWILTYSRARPWSTLFSFSASSGQSIAPLWSLAEHSINPNKRPLNHKRKNKDIKSREPSAAARFTVARWDEEHKGTRWGNGSNSLEAECSGFTTSTANSRREVRNSWLGITAGFKESYSRLQQGQWLWVKRNKPHSKGRSDS